MFCPMKFNVADWGTLKEDKWLCEEGECAWWDKEGVCCAILSVIELLGLISKTASKFGEIIR